MINHATVKNVCFVLYIKTIYHSWLRCFWVRSFLLRKVCLVCMSMSLIK